MALPAAGSADSLYQDPTPAYQPVLQAINAQEVAATQRYADNQADIKTIFGSLTTIGEQDAARIQNQFKQTILEQQGALASRTAEARAGVAAGQAQMVATGAERGGGPAMNVSPVATAAEQGIAKSNEYQTTWENLLRANSMQAQQDAAVRGQGYQLEGQTALTKLRKDLEANLLQLGSQKAGVLSDIAQAKLQAKQTVLNTKYQEAQSALAASRSAAAASATAANKTKTYPKTAAGWTAEVNDVAGSPGAANQIRSIVARSIKEVAGGRNISTIPVTKAELLQKLNYTRGVATDVLFPYIIEYVNKYSGLK